MDWTYSPQDEGGGTAPQDYLLSTPSEEPIEPPQRIFSHAEFSAVFSGLRSAIEKYSQPFI